MRSTPARRLVASLIAASAFVLGASAARAQFSAWPVTLSFDGETTERTITVRNESETRFEVRLYAGDFDQADDGTHAFLAAGEHPRTCRGRVEVHPSTLGLDPGATASARIRMAPGDSTCWSAVFVEKVSTLEGGIRVGQRIAVKTYGVGREARVAAEVSEVAVATEDGRWLVRVALANPGEVPVRPEGEIQVRDFEGALVGTVPLDRFVILPGHVRRLAAPLPDLGPGAFLAIPVFDVGLPHLLGGQAAFENEGG